MHKRVEDDGTGERERKNGGRQNEGEKNIHVLDRYLRRESVKIREKNEYEKSGVD